MISNNFELQRGDNDRIHLSVEDYKKITGFENSKTFIGDNLVKKISNRDELVYDPEKFIYTLPKIDYNKMKKLYCFSISLKSIIFFSLLANANSSPNSSIIFSNSFNSLKYSMYF